MREGSQEVPPASAPDGAGAGETALLALALLAVECGLCWLALRHARWAAALAGHAVAVAATAWRVQRRRAQDPRPGTLLWTATLFLGPFAAAGVLLQLALLPFFARSAPAPGDWYALLVPEPPHDEAADRREELDRLAGELAGYSFPAPFVDVVAGGTREQKRVLLTRLGRDFQPAFAPALRRALRDEHSAIRVQAAATIAKIEDGLHARLAALERACGARPGDFECRLALARIHDGHATLGLLDEHREREHRRRALALYAECRQERPGDAELRSAVARLLVREGRAGEAALELEDAQRGGNVPPSLLPGYLEALFRAGRFPELRALARAGGRPAERGALPEAVRRALDFWRADGVVAAGKGGAA